MTLEKLFRLKYELIARREKSLEISAPASPEAEVYRRGFDQALEEFFRGALNEVLEDETEKKSA
jgi:hypothetical protein